MDAGFNTPAAAVQTYLWAARSGNLQRWVEAMDLTAEERSRTQSLYKNSLSELPFAGAKGVRIESVYEPDPNIGTIYHCVLDLGSEQPKRHCHFIAKRVEGGWRLRRNFQMEDIPVSGIRLMASDVVLGSVLTSLVPK